jgi:hypothetical protein
VVQRRSAIPGCAARGCPEEKLRLVKELEEKGEYRV